jgi:small multidrug resistance pump
MHLYWIVLAVAIAAELFGTSCLKASQGMTKLLPSLGVLGGYSLTFYLLSIIVRQLPVGIVYACWSGLGTIGIAFIGKYYFQEPLGPAAWVGIALVVAGVAILYGAAPAAH